VNTWVRNSGGHQVQRVTASTGVFEFATTENPLGSPWRNGAANGLDWQDMQSGSGNAYGTGASPGAETDPIACLTGYNANHYIEATIFRAGGYSPAINHEIELHTRCTISANSITSYEFLMNTAGNYQVVRWDGAIGVLDFTITVTEQNGGPTGLMCVNGDVVRIEVTGSNFTMKLNGTTLATWTDSTYSTGGPGIASFWRPDVSIVPSSLGFSRVVVGNL
jgi:hypothetical protein